MLTSHADVVRSFIDVVWNGGNLSHAHHYVHEEYAVDGAIVGVEWVRDNVLSFRRAFPDLHVAVEMLIENESGVAAVLRLRGTHLGEWKGWPASGNIVNYREAAFWTVADGKLIAGDFVADTLGLRVQLGAISRSAWRGPS